MRDEPDRTAGDWKGVITMPYEIRHNLPLKPYEDELDSPYCPRCGAECETVCIDDPSEIAGCDCCLTAYDAGEVSECWPEYPELG